MIKEGDWLRGAGEDPRGVSEVANDEGGLKEVPVAVEVLLLVELVLTSVNNPHSVTPFFPSYGCK